MAYHGENRGRRLARRGAGLASAGLGLGLLTACAAASPAVSSGDPDIGQEVQAQIARAASQASMALRRLQMAEAPIAGPPVRPVAVPVAALPMGSSARMLPRRMTPVGPGADLPRAQVAQAVPVRAVAAVSQTSPQRQPGGPEMNVSGLPPELQQPTTIKWNDTVDGALRTIAQRIGYAYVPPHPAFANPPKITLDERATPVADVLAEIGLQVQKFGAVNVDYTNKTITFQMARPVGAT